MAGTIEGGINARNTNYERYGKDFYARIGSIGGKKSTTGGFASPVVCQCDYGLAGHYKRECAGHRGGLISRRGKAIYNG